MYFGSDTASNAINSISHLTRFAHRSFAFCFRKGLNDGGVANEGNNANLVVAGFEFVNGLSRRGDKERLLSKVRQEQKPQKSSKKEKTRSPKKEKSNSPKKEILKATASPTKKVDAGASVGTLDTASLSKSAKGASRSKSPKKDAKIAKKKAKQEKATEKKERERAEEKKKKEDEIEVLKKKLEKSEQKLKAEREKRVVAEVESSGILEGVSTLETAGSDGPNSM